MPTTDSKCTTHIGPTINLPRYNASLLDLIGFNQLRHQAAAYPKHSFILSCCAAVVGLLAWRNDQQKVSYVAFSIAAYQMLAFLFEYSRVLPFDFRSTQNVKQFEQGDVVDPKSGKLLARLNYQGNCPVLYMLTADPFEQGRAAALATYKQNVLALTKFYRLAPTLLTAHHDIQRLSHGKLPHPHSHHANYEAEQRRLIAFPPRLQKEIEGFVEGYNDMLHRHGWPYYGAPPPLTKDEMEDLLRIPDSYKLLACSVAAKQTADGSEAVRLFDFEMLGYLEKKGAYLIVKPTEHLTDKKPRWTMSFTHAPGFIRVSLINDYNLAVFINEATNMSNKRHHPHGIAELALAHAIAENCCTVEEALTFIEANPAATSHLLTIMDPVNMICVQLLPLRSNEPFNVIRSEKHQLRVTNHMHDRDGNRMPETDSWITSLARYTLIDEAFRNGTSMTDLARSLSVPQTAHMLHLSYQHEQKPSASPNTSDVANTGVDTPTIPTNLSITYQWGGRHHANRSSENMKADEIFSKASTMYENNLTHS